jgi:hypothetical protein
MRCQNSILETRCAMLEKIGNEHGEEELETQGEDMSFTRHRN